MARPKNQSAPAVPHVDVDEPKFASAMTAMREEGVAVRYLEIAGVWEDHVRYAITEEEWAVRGSELLSTWAY